MTIFAKVREGFTVVLDDVVHEAGAVLRLAEGVFGLHAHKLEVIPADEAKGLPIANEPKGAPAADKTETDQTKPAAAGTDAGKDGGASGQTKPAAPAEASNAAGAPKSKGKSAKAPDATEKGAA